MDPRQITTLFIDLDDTVYPSSSGLWDTIRDRIALYMHDCVHLSWEEIPSIRQRLLNTYGTTMRGLESEFHIDEADYLEFVHKVPLEKYIAPDPELHSALISIPQRKIIFTNADDKHAERVLNFLQISECFEAIIDIKAITPHCKPQVEAYYSALSKAGVGAENCAMIDDSLNNLASAHQLGLYTIRVGSTDTSPQVNAGIEMLKDLPQVLNHHGRK
jgi:putative hydrolase of the HAD superfamily